MTHALTELCNARVGRLLKGKWRLERVLGIGGMAAVYEGVHTIGRRDAIKILHPEVARQPDLKRRFEVEASATNRFRHRGAVEIRDFDVSEDGCPFMVMEMLDGESLGERARRTGGISEKDLLRIVDELLDVLVAAHREGIVHRDIKLDNVFLTRDGEVKILDFGVARILSGPVQTIAGTRLGTPAYMPPEQLRGLEVDGRADLFAVGATMFRLLTKKRIHEAPTEGQLILKMSTEPAPKARSVEPSISEDVGLVIDRALAFHASARYQDAITMQDDVRHVMAGRPPPFARARLLPDHAPGPNPDRPTLAPPPKPSFASDPTSATVQGVVVGAAAFATAPTGVGPTPTVAQAAFATSPTGVALDPTRAAPAELPAPMVAPSTGETSTHTPFVVRARAAPARSSIGPVVGVIAGTVVLAVTGLVLYLRASATDEPKAPVAAMADDRAGPSAAPAASPSGAASALEDVEVGVARPSLAAESASASSDPSAAPPADAPDASATPQSSATDAPAAPPSATPTTPTTTTTTPTARPPTTTPPTTTPPTATPPRPPTAPTPTPKPKPPAPNDKGRGEGNGKKK